MAHESFDKRNFLFFLNEAHPLSIEDSLTGALAVPSSWDAVAKMVKTARQKDVFVRSIKKVQLYIHVPFCGRLCTFCHCARVLLRRRTDIDAYVNALSQQIKFLAPAYKGMDASSLCFGGGTPSILDEQQLTAILDSVDKEFPSSKRKILFEVNPASWTASKLTLLSTRGLSRLSIGIQSLDEKVLKQATRSQTKKKVLWCLRSARKAGVNFVNVDFIAGLPGQTLKGLIKDMKIAIAEGANIVHVHPYCSLSLKQLCGPSETVVMFIKRRDAMMKAAANVLQEAGFRRKGLGAYTLQEEGEDHQEEAYSRLEAAVAAFGPSAKGQVPGAVYYCTKSSSSTDNLTSVVASSQNRSYAMAHYAVIAMIEGLDGQDFSKRFGVSLDDHCGEGLRYLQQSGLISHSKGVWKFSGRWEVRRIREYVALSRILFGENMLTRLKERFINQYNPKLDYSGGNSLLNAYTNSWLMSLYYKMGV